MKKRKRLLVLLLASCLLLSMAGCSNADSDNLKDNLINGWNEMLQNISRHRNPLLA